MSYERGLAAIRLEAPPEIPHTQYITHPRWLEHLQATSGRAGADFPQILDFDFLWWTTRPDGMEHGRWTDMGHGIWQEDGSDYRPPSPSPFADVEAIYELDPVEEYGTPDFKALSEQYQGFAEANKSRDCVVPGGLYRSVISFAIDAFGWEALLLAAGTDPERFGGVLNRWADLLMIHVEAWAATDIEVFLTHDDLVWTQGAIFRPDFYQEYVFPNYKRYWDCLKDADKKVLFCSDGDFTDFVDDIAAAGADGFIFEPTTDLEYICKNYGRTHVIIGNADTRILTFDTPEAVEAEVARCIETAGDCPGFFFAVGNHIPPNVPIENADACMKAYHDMRKRRTLTTLEKKDEDD